MGVGALGRTRKSQEAMGAEEPPAPKAHSSIPDVSTTTLT